MITVKLSKSTQKQTLLKQYKIQRLNLTTKTVSGNTMAAAFDKYKRIFVDWCFDFDRRITSKYSRANKALESGIRPAFAFIGMSIALFFFSLWKFGPNITSNLIGFIFPTYFSFVALRTETIDDDDDDVQWLSYWVIYAFFVCGESVSDAFVNWIPPLYFIMKSLFYWAVYPFFVFGEYLLDAFVNWVPLYYIMKFVFLAWLMHPQFHGAQILFTYVINPFLTKLEKTMGAIFVDKRLALKAQLLTSKNTTLNLPKGVVNDVKNAAPTEAKNVAKEALNLSPQIDVSIL